MCATEYSACCCGIINGVIFVVLHAILHWLEVPWVLLWLVGPLCMAGHNATRIQCVYACLLMTGPVVQ
jgi:hypothetical protein